MPNEPRKPGRPPGAKNKPKQAREPSRMGRPSIWPERTICRGVTAPEAFFIAFRDPEFKRKVWDLVVDFNAVKS